MLPASEVVVTGTELNSWGGVVLHHSLFGNQLLIFANSIESTYTETSNVSLIRKSDINKTAFELVDLLPWMPYCLSKPGAVYHTRVWRFLP